MRVLDSVGIMREQDTCRRVVGRRQCRTDVQDAFAAALSTSTVPLAKRCITHNMRVAAFVEYMSRWQGCRLPATNVPVVLMT